MQNTISQVKLKGKKSPGEVTWPLAIGERDTMTSAVLHTARPLDEEGVIFSLEIQQIFVQ